MNAARQKPRAEGVCLGVVLTADGSIFAETLTETPADAPADVARLADDTREDPILTPADDTKDGITAVGITDGKPVMTGV